MVSPEVHDLIQRASRIYEERLRRELELTHLHDYVAIEPDSGDFFIGQSHREAVALARAAHPDRMCYLMRVGHPAVWHLGFAGSFPKLNQLLGERRRVLDDRR